MKLTRREFLKLCSATAIGAGISQLYIPKVVEALEKAVKGRPSVIWLQGASDTGCSVSLLNTTHPSIAEVLLKIISLQYHATIMAAQGEMATYYMDIVADKAKGEFFLVVEGSVPTAEDGIYCVIGEREGKELTMLEALKSLARKAKAVVAVGACAAFGGIPAGKPNPTGAKSVREVLELEGINTPVINIPGCPSHPDWIVGTLVHVLLYGLPELDKYLRPKIFFLETVHQNCTNFSYFNNGQLAKKFADKGCLIQLGCKGPTTNSDCPLRRWNSGVNWCIGSGSVCIGCCSTNFPDDVSPLYSALPKELWPKKEDSMIA